MIHLLFDFNSKYIADIGLKSQDFPLSETGGMGDGRPYTYLITPESG